MFTNDRQTLLHEVAHEWFYGVVGSDQVREPFADESVTEFLPLTLTGGFSAPECRRTRLDLTVYQYGDCYGNAFANADCFGSYSHALPARSGRAASS